MGVLKEIDELLASGGGPGGSSEAGWLETGIDWISRPYRGISEAVGEFREDDGDVVEGFFRGLGGEYEHPGVGEQLIPHKPRAGALESFSRSSGRLALDILTDPLTYAGLGLAGKGVKGVGKAAKFGLKKIGIPADDALQWLGRGALPTNAVLRVFGKKGGNKIARGIDRAYERSETIIAAEEFELFKQAKGLGLLKRPDLLEEASELIEAGAIGTHQIPAVNKFATYVQGTLKRIGGDVERFEDFSKDKFKLMDPFLRTFRNTARKRAKGLNKLQREEAWQALLAKGRTGNPKIDKLVDWMQGETDRLNFIPDPAHPSPFAALGKTFWQRPFSLRDNYIPWIPSREFMEKAASKQGFKRAAEQVAELNKIPVSEAEGILRKTIQPKRAGNIEYARTMRLPPQFRERNPLRFLPQYYRRTFERMAFADEFGIKGKRLGAWVDEAVDGGLDRKWALDVKASIEGANPSTRATDDIARKLVGFQVMTKMGPLSALANLSQNANTIIVNGGVAFTRGILRSMTKEGYRQGAIAYQRGVRDLLEQVAGGQQTWAARYLTGVGFTPIERLNRIIAANAGIVRSEALLKKTGGKLTPLLKKLGVQEPDAIDFMTHGRLATGAADRVGFLASEATQHATHWKDLPHWWRSPTARVMMQYKQFLFRQSAFVVKEILNPAFQFYKSRGKSGSLTPLMRATATFGIGGQAVGKMRDYLKGVATAAVGGEHEPREFDTDHPILQVLTDSMLLGSLGMAGDLVERAARRDVRGWILGPTVGDVADLMEGGMDMAGKAMEGEDISLEKLGAQIGSKIIPLATGAGASYLERFPGGGAASLALRAAGGVPTMISRSQKPKILEELDQLLRR